MCVVSSASLQKAKGHVPADVALQLFLIVLSKLGEALNEQKMFGRRAGLCLSDSSICKNSPVSLGLKNGIEILWWYDVGLLTC
jgi:hypothetical protein